MSGPEPYYQDADVTLHLGDCRVVLAAMEEASIDAVVCDPPYDLTSGKKGGSGEASLNEAHPAGRSRITTGGGFMGKEWDATGVAFDPATWREALRALKPGGYLLAFGGTRTWHRMVCAIEDAGFEIRDSIDWIYGSGFPKSDACLKPAHEPIVMARKPSRNSLPLPGLDACKVAHASQADLAESKAKNPGRSDTVTSDVFGADRPQQSVDDAGRWPPNILLTHSPRCEFHGSKRVKSGNGVRGRNALGIMNDDGWRPSQEGQEVGYADADGMETVEAWDCAEGCPVAELDRQSGVLTSGTGAVKRSSAKGGARSASIGAESRPEGMPMLSYGDSGGASRFFPAFRYQAKAPASERPRLADGTAWATVKPLGLMRWLVRLVTPPGGTVLDPFCGSGTTAEACIIEGFSCVTIDREEKALKLALERWRKPIQPVLFGEAS